MSSISRRDFTLGTASLALLGAASVRAQTENEDGARIAIIDSSEDTSNFLGPLEQAGVQVVSRYYSRKCQHIVPFKRFAYNPPRKHAEACGANTIRDGVSEFEMLLDKFAIISVYQYQSNTPAKFVLGLKDTQDKIKKRFATAGGKKKRYQVAAEVEAEEDAQAALKQAGIVNQHPKAAIYFGVDFDLRDAGYARDQNNKLVKDEHGNIIESKLALEACEIYFRKLKELVGNPLGIYGNGYVNRILRSADLVKYSWVSESRSFCETAKFIREGFVKDGKKEEWHLFQHLIDRRWFVVDGSCAKGLDVDGLIQNPFYEDIGAWNRKGLWSADPARTNLIFCKRRVVTLTKDVPIYNEPSETSGIINKTKCKLVDEKWTMVPDNHAGFHRSVRVMTKLTDSNNRNWLHVDVDEDGVGDGWCLEVYFAESIKKIPDHGKDS